jgi:tetratricopeptide (TPR) repeat protein
MASKSPTNDGQKVDSPNEPVAVPSTADAVGDQARVKGLISYGQRFMSADDFDGAIAAFEVARRLAPADSEVWTQGLIDAYSKRGWRKMDDGQHVLAADDFDRAVKLASTKPDATIPDQIVRVALFGRGAARLESGAPKAALDDFTKIVTAIPSSAAAHIKRGIALSQLGRHRDALDDFDRAVMLNGKSYAAFNNRGVCYLNLKMYDNAVKDFTSAVRINAKIANGYYNRYIAYRCTDQVDKANDDLARAAEIDPSFRNAPAKPLPPQSGAGHPTARNFSTQITSVEMPR